MVRRYKGYRTRFSRCFVAGHARLRRPSRTAFSHRAFEINVGDAKRRATSPAVEPTAPAAPRFDTVEINRRVSQEVGYDIHATIDGWKRGLDRLEGEFHRANLRYVELNNFRDALQGVRSEVTALWNALRPRLAAAKAEVDLLEPAPAARPTAGVATGRAETR